MSCIKIFTYCVNTGRRLVSIDITRENSIFFFAKMLSFGLYVNDQSFGRFIYRNRIRSTKSFFSVIVNFRSCSLQPRTDLTHRSGQ